MAEFRMPSLGADMERGTVLEWRVKPGDVVRRGDIVAVVQTEKSDIEVEVFTTGVVDELLVGPGEEVAVGAVLARIHAPDGSPDDRSPPAPVASAGAAPGASMRGARPRSQPSAARPRVVSPMVRHLADVEHVDLARLTGSGIGGVVTRTDVQEAVRRREPEPTGVGCREPVARAASATTAVGRVRASPRARRLAIEAGADLGAVHGTGPGGTITGDDVRRSAGGPAPAAPRPPGTRAGDQREARRAAVAALMARSKREIPHYYLSTTIDMSIATGWLEEHNRARSVADRLLPVVMLLKATARAALETPEVNGFWVDDHFEPQPEVDLGMAVSLRGGGLLAPTIRSAHLLTLDDLMTELRGLVARARSGTLRSSEMSPPTITVTSLGDEGVEAVFPVIYPPQVAMVGFGRIMARPWAADGMLGVRPVVTATLAGDHRASDGHRGGHFLTLLDRLLQEPDAL